MFSTLQRCSNDHDQVKSVDGRVTALPSLSQGKESYSLQNDGQTIPRGCRIRSRQVIYTQLVVCGWLSISDGNLLYEFYLSFACWDNSRKNIT